MTLIDNKIKKDKKFGVEYNDERNVVIRNKTNAMMSPILLLLFGFQAIYAIAYDLHLIAIFDCVVVVLSPIVMMIISKYYERKN